VFSLVVVSVPTTLAAWSYSAGTRGRLAARTDIARGHYKILGYGYPSPWRSGYSRLLHDRYGIEFEAVTGCIVSHSLMDYVDAYNKTSIAGANRKFGHDVAKETAEEAIGNWQLQHPSEAEQ
jgi:hypothetical protein